MMEDHFTKSEEATFLALRASLFISENHFIELTKDHFSLFGRSTPTRFKRESALGALPNRTEVILQSPS
jgi:hypothetical protein